MKQHYPCRVLYLALLLAPLAVTAQQDNQPGGQPAQKMLRIFEDNDFINIRGRGTDEAYTNGTRIDYFYTKKRAPHFFIAKWLTAPGDSNVQIAGWGLTQLMFTPRDISISAYQPHDYPYSAALFLTHSYYLYNPAKKTSVQTELMLGVRGPAALGKQLQKFVHRVIHYQEPMGWDNQLPDKIIANVKCTLEKQLYAYGHWLEINGGADIYAGTFLNTATIYPTIRLGKMHPYFNGLMDNYLSGDTHVSGKKKNLQAYLVFRPGLTLTATNALLQQGNFRPGSENINEKRAPVRDAVWEFNGGAVLSINQFAISFNQNITAALVHQLYAHEIGNISFYVAL